jgi:hypothetical protein
VEVTATRQVAAAWEHEVRRAVSRSGTVTGEARIQQPLDASVGAPALASLERALERGAPGWTRVDEGYRRDVEGGYALYSPDDRTLQIVATASDVVHGQGEALARLAGSIQEDFTARGQGRYYDDGYRGRTVEVAREEARRAAEAGVDEQVRARVEGDKQAAEAAAAGAVEADAGRQAQVDWEARAADRRGRLEQEAAAHLAAVGVQARRAFHELLAVAYRDALLALARSRGAQGLQCTDRGDVIEIDFLLPD